MLIPPQIQIGTAYSAKQMEKYKTHIKNSVLNIDLHKFRIGSDSYLLLNVLLAEIECWWCIQCEIETAHFWWFAGYWSTYTSITKLK